MDTDGSAETGWVTVVVPAVSRPRQLTAITRELRGVLPSLGVPYEVLYLVRSDDPDAVAEARRCAKDDAERTRVLEFTRATSEAAMLSAVVGRVRGEILVTVPPRLEIDVGVLPQLYRVVCSEADVAVAARTPHPGSSRRLQSRVFNRLMSAVSGARFQDLASGTRALRRTVLEEIPLYGDFHRYLPVLAQRLGFRVREIAAEQHPEAHTPIVHAPLVYLWRAIDLLAVFFISRFTRHPLRLFGGVGTAFAGVGAAILLWIGIERLLGEALGDRPILVLAVLFVGLGVQAFTIGLLGELVLFFRGREIRDYRIAAVYDADSGAQAHRSASPKRESEEGGSSSP